MKCGFCGRELAPGTLECPYCHYQLSVEPQVLSPDERDAFEGVTIEADGSAHTEGQSKGSYGKPRQEGRGAQPQFTVHTFGCGSSLLLTALILCGFLALVFFLLPVFFVYALVGAAVMFILRLFSGFF